MSKYTHYVINNKTNLNNTPYEEMPASGCYADRHQNNQPFLGPDLTLTKHLLEIRS